MSTRQSILLTQPDYCGTLAAARCLGRAGYDVVMSGSSRQSPGMFSKYIQKRLRSPSFTDSSAWLEWLIETGRNSPGMVLYPTSDDLAWLQALHADRLAPHFRTWAPKVEVYERLLDKAALHEACARVGLETPTTFAPLGDAALEQAVQAAPLPVLIKQRTQILSTTNDKGVLVHERGALAGEFRAFRAHNRHHAALTERMPNASEPLIQQYFSEGISGSLQVSGFIDETGKLFAARAAKKLLQRPKTLGISLCLEATPLDPKLAEQVRQLCLDVGYFGVFGVEFLQVHGRPLLIDFNPRYYHFMALDVARGLRLPLLTTLAALGQRDELAREVERAQHDVSQVNSFTYRFQLTELLLAQSATGTMPLSQSMDWWRWYREHRGSLVDAIDDPEDHLPHLVDVVTGVMRRVRHPATFIRRVALDR